MKTVYETERNLILDAMDAQHDAVIELTICADKLKYQADTNVLGQPCILHDIAIKLQDCATQARSTFTELSMALTTLAKEDEPV